MHIKQLAQTGMAAHHRDNVMAKERNPTTEPSELIVYQIRVTGHLGREWTDWFDGLSITLEDNGETLLSGRWSTRLRCTDCSEKCVISDCHCSRSRS